MDFKRYFKNLDPNLEKKPEDLVDTIIENSSWKTQPDFIEEYQLGGEEYIVCYNVFAEATPDTHDTQGTAMELDIVQIFIKGYDINDNQVVFDMTDLYFSYEKEYSVDRRWTGNIQDMLYEAHTARYGD